MAVARTARITALILPLIVSNVAAAVDSNAVVVEASGNVPGFTPRELAAYLARKMHEAIAGPWQFSAGSPGAVPAPNRMVWSFKTLRVVWKSGSHRGFSSQENSASRLSAEVKLYLRNDYQMTMVAHPTVSDGADDEALAEMVRDVAHAMFVENKSDLP